jgi:hypothetical protein
LKFCATARTDSCDRSPTLIRMVAGSGRTSEAATADPDVDAVPVVVKDICKGTNSFVAPATTL